MKRRNLFLSVMLTACFLLFGAKAAFADDCAALGGNIVGTECRVTGAAPGTPPNNRAGTFNLDETLRITGAGVVTVPPIAGGNTLTINITGGLIMEAGARIVGDAAGAAGIGANITINTSGDMLLAGGAPGASITANHVVSKNGGSCSGGHSGNITLTSAGGNINTEGGSVIAVGQLDLGANTSKCPAGEIIITTSGQGTIDIDGLVLSQSAMSGTGANNPKGGGPITIIAGCNLLISDTGVVSSRGSDPGADLVHLEACAVTIIGLVESTGPGHVLPGDGNRCNDDAAAHPIGSKHSQFFDGCVEVWSGTSITIVNDANNHGEVSADTGQSGGNNGRGWIDLFARGDISITGNTKYAVHANGGLGLNTDDGGLITVKSSGGRVLTFGMAMQAHSVSGGGIGGDIVVEASQNIEFGTASIQADGNPGGGGDITARSFHGAINGALPGELNAGPDATGAVGLTACTANPATSYDGNVVGAETDAVNCALPGEDPAIPAGVPPGSCAQLCRPDNPNCDKASVTSVLNPITGRFPGNLGPDIVVQLDLGQTVQAGVSSATDLNGDGYILVLVVKDATGQLGGSTTENVVVSLAYPKRFGLLACSVTIKALDKTLPAGNVAASASSPAGSPENIFVMDLHSYGSTGAGWRADGNGRYFRNVANSGSGVGIAFYGNGNTMHNGNGNDNALDGISMNGNGNTVDSSDAFGNKGIGVSVVGNDNKVLKVDAGDKGKGNSLDGVNVAGNRNTIQEVDAFANAGYGIVVSGDSNKVLKNQAGDAKKGNGKDGILLSGMTNTVQENSAFANGGNGIKGTGPGNVYKKNAAGDRGDKANSLDGFMLSGGASLQENTAIGNLGIGFNLATTGFTLTKNVAGGTGSGQPNGGCEYLFGGNEGNGGSNKINGAALASFTAGCKN